PPGAGPARGDAAPGRPFASARVARLRRTQRPGGGAPRAAGRGDAAEHGAHLRKAVPAGGDPVPADLTAVVFLEVTHSRRRPQGRRAHRGMKMELAEAKSEPIREASAPVPLPRRSSRRPFVILGAVAAVVLLIIGG